LLDGGSGFGLLLRWNSRPTYLSDQELLQELKQVCKKGDEAQEWPSAVLKVWIAQYAVPRPVEPRARRHVPFCAVMFLERVIEIPPAFNHSAYAGDMSSGDREFRKIGLACPNFFGLRHCRRRPRVRRQVREV
jgi:hypothetical protein